MDVDVITTVTIQRPRPEVSAYAADPDNAPFWYVNIKSVEWKSEPPVCVGSKVAFTAQFFGKRLAYRNRGTPAGFSRLLAPLMAAAMRRANRADLSRLKALLERDPPAG